MEVAEHKSVSGKIEVVWSCTEETGEALRKVEGMDLTGGLPAGQEGWRQFVREICQVWALMRQK